MLNLAIHLLMGIGMTDLSRLLLQVTGRGRRVKVLVGVGLVLAAVQIVLLVLSDTRGSAASFTDTFGTIPTIAWYQATFFAWFGMISGYTAFEMLRRNRSGESKAFRIGFDLLGTGCLLGLGAVALKMIQIGLEAQGSGESFSRALVAGIQRSAGANDSGVRRGIHSSVLRTRQGRLPRPGLNGHGTSRRFARLWPTWCRRRRGAVHWEQQALTCGAGPRRRSSTAGSFSSVTSAS